MFPKGEIARNLLGSLEIMLFMRRGADRFGGGRDEMLRSFLLWLIVLPLTWFSIYFLQPERPEIADMSYPFVLFLFTARVVIVTFLYFAAIYLLLKNYDRTQYFFAFLSASNWLGIIPSFLALLPVLTVAAGFNGWDEVKNILLVLTIYGYVFYAFMATFVLHVPWQMAGFIAILSLAFDQTSLDIMYWLAARL